MRFEFLAVFLFAVAGASLLVRAKRLSLDSPSTADGQFDVAQYAQSVQDPAPFADVQTTSGPVRGWLTYSAIERKPFYAFRGIPYGESPAFARRFLPPLPKRPWSQRRDCYEFGNICPQYDPRNTTHLVGDEDCLFLNVYTPNTQPDRPMPVMFYIHGGGFFFGSGNDDLQGPDLLINRRDVVVITINYRLGVLGFMSLGTPMYSGNQGLKDQQLALRWAHRNVARFGGDPQLITIFGQSAGSASCYFHTIAPGSRGLFKQTILMSFTFAIWSVFERGHHLQDMYAFSNRQGYHASHFADLMAFLHTVEPGQIVASFPIVQYHVGGIPKEISSKWLPVVENSQALQPFMQSTPTQLMLMDKFDASVNVMGGYTTAEALFYTTPNCLHPATLDNFNQNFEIELPSMHFNRAYNSSSYRRVAEEIRQRYFPGGIALNGDYDTLQTFVQLMSHVFQNYQIDRRLRLLADKSHGRVFMYRFGLLSALNYYKNWLGAQAQFGASHADDICHVFHCGYIGQVYANATATDTVEGAELRRLIGMMTGLYTNFAATGDPMGGLPPVPEEQPFGARRWKRTTRSDQLNYVDITNGGLVVGVNPLEDSIAFWARLVRDNQDLMTHNIDACVDLVIRALLNGE